VFACEVGRHLVVDLLLRYLLREDAVEFVHGLVVEVSEFHAAVLREGFEQVSYGHDQCSTKARAGHTQVGVGLISLKCQLENK